jgi:hypothetical protein
MSRSLRAPAVAVALLVVLSGCSSVPGGLLRPGPSVSNADVQLVDGEPALVFNYTVSDFAEVLIQGPSGQVFARGTLEPENSRVGVQMAAVPPGEYNIIIQRGGDTVKQQPVTFDGAEPSLTSTSVNWSGRTLAGATITVENSGDVPVQVVNVSATARDMAANLGTVNTWVPSGGSKTISVSPSFNSLKIEEPGDVRGEVVVATDTGELTDSFQHRLDPVNLEVVEVSPNWNHATLETATVRVRNTGDFPARTEFEVYHAGEEIGSSLKKQIPADGEATLEATALSYLFKADAGGEVRLQGVVNSSTDFAEVDLSHRVEPADISLVSFNPIWQDGELADVQTELRNSGDAPAEVTVTYTVGDTKVADVLATVEGGETVRADAKDSAFSGYGALASVRNGGGSVPVTVSVSGPGTEITETKEKQFASASADIQLQRVSFTPQYRSERSEISSISLSVRNTGEVPIAYDAIKIEVAGTSRTESLFAEQTVDTGEQSTESVFLSNGISVSPGSHRITITLLDGGEEVATTTTTVSTD